MIAVLAVTPSSAGGGVPWSTVLIAFGPLAGVVVGSLLTGRHADRAHRADVRREAYGELLVAAYALEAHLREAPHHAAVGTEAWAEMFDEVDQRTAELLAALDVAAAAVMVAGSLVASAGAQNLKIAGMFGRLRQVAVPDQAEAEARRGLWPGLWTEPTPAADMEPAIAAFLADARREIARDRLRWWRLRIALSPRRRRARAQAQLAAEQFRDDGDPANRDNT